MHSVLLSYRVTITPPEPFRSLYKESPYKDNTERNNKDRGDQTGWPGSPARGRLFVSFDYSGDPKRSISYFRQLKVRCLKSSSLSSALMMRLNAESEQTYPYNFAKITTK